MIFGQLFFGLTGVIFGTGRFLEPAAIVPQLDNQFRYLSGIYPLISILIWWMVPTIERHPPADPNHITRPTLDDTEPFDHPRLLLLQYRYDLLVRG